MYSNWTAIKHSKLVKIFLKQDWSFLFFGCRSGNRFWISVWFFFFFTEQRTQFLKTFKTKRQNINMNLRSFLQRCKNSDVVFQELESQALFSKKKNQRKFKNFFRFWRTSRISWFISALQNKNTRRKQKLKVSKIKHYIEGLRIMMPLVFISLLLIPFLCSC